MKKIVLKKWLNNLLIGIATISFLLVAITIESDLTIQYLQFVIVNVVLFTLSTLLLIKYGRPLEED